jgi:hypothetical protein
MKKEAEERTFTWLQIRHWSFCWGLVIVGAIAAVFGDELPWEWAHPIAKELGLGSFIAGLLAVFVEPYFRKEFARDMFFVAFRYILPPELRDEVTKILRFSFIAEKQLWIVKVEKIDGDAETVLVTTAIEKIFRNKTALKQQLGGYYQIPEFNFSNGKVAITECRVQTDKQQLENYEVNEEGYSTAAQTEKLDVFPNETITMQCKATQYRRINDVVTETFLSPALNPAIEVIVPVDFDYQAGFGRSGDVEKSRYTGRHTLSGVYFPGQHMFVQWWPKETK